MRYQHSFWYDEAKEIFEEVLKADPTCAIAQWGIALPNPCLSHPLADQALHDAFLARNLAAILSQLYSAGNTRRQVSPRCTLTIVYSAARGVGRHLVF